RRGEGGQGRGGHPLPARRRRGRPPARRGRAGRRIVARRSVGRDVLRHALRRERHLSHRLRGRPQLHSERRRRPARRRVERIQHPHRLHDRWARGRAGRSGGRRQRGPDSPQRGVGAQLIVAHLDLDAFFAAVEELESPELRTKPLVVGGDPHGRGVVATANYAARSFGIQSAMSCAEALRRCPHAVFIRPRHSVYREYSRDVWETVRGVVPTVERTGLDEGYLDVGEVAQDFLAARKVAEAVQTAVRAATSLTCALGVSTSKVVAKIASDYRKPGGLTVVPGGTEARFLAPFAVRRLPGVGPKAEARLI